MTELAKGKRVEGIAAHTITTYSPRCTFRIDQEGHRADCVTPDCERVKFRRGDEFFLRENVDGWSSIIEYRDAEYKIMNHFDCDGKLVSKTWVQVRLPDGTTGWAYRENFAGTEAPAGIILIPQ